MEYDDQSHHPIIVSVATSIAPYNDECLCKLIFRIKVWK